MMDTLYNIAKNYAITCHNGTNHKYDGKPYETHLNHVVEIATKFLHLIPHNQQENILAACWCHDVIEDCRQTYNDVKSHTNVEIAEIVFALTNEKGKTRKDRANDKYYEGIRNTPYATFVKVCDRIANYEYSIRGRMRDAYDKEMQRFVSRMYDSQYREMFEYLNELSKPTPTQIVTYTGTSLSFSKDYNEITKLQQDLIYLLESQVVDLTMMSKIELGDDVIEEIKRLKALIK